VVRELCVGLFSKIGTPQLVEKYGLLLPQKQMQQPQKAIYFLREFKVFLLRDYTNMQITIKMF